MSQLLISKEKVLPGRRLDGRAVNGRRWLNCERLLERFPRQSEFLADLRYPSFTDAKMAGGLERSMANGKDQSDGTQFWP
jgi:hypothetical protein